MTELKDKQLFVFDMDGTIYLGNRVFPAALEFIKNLRKSGKKILFFTNNASHSREFYLAKLESRDPSRDGDSSRKHTANSELPEQLLNLSLAHCFTITPSYASLSPNT